MRRVAILVAALLAIGGAAFILLRENDPPPGFQGWVEAYLVYVAAEDGGRIARLAVEPGTRTEAGAVLFELDAAWEKAQLSEARARLDQAEAQLANLRAALQRPEQIAVLRAQEERARAQLDLSQGEWERQKILFDRGYSAKARLDQALAAFERDKAALAEVLRQIEAAQLAGRAGEIEAAEAARAAAEAAVRQAETRLARRVVSAPVAAQVQDVFFRPGEVVQAGQPVLALLPPENRRIRFYVPEPALVAVLPGTRVAVTCDSCPERIAARVTFVSREAEFTPPVIFSEEERAKLVFRAEAQPLEGPPLPVGLPVRVHLASEEP
jgi:HlyD family secretion protein